MKKLISLLLLCVLLFSCAACTDTPTAGIEFNPQTPKEAFDLMLRVFQSQTAYRRICNTYPDHEESGSVSDLVFVGIGTDGQALCFVLRGGDASWVLSVLRVNAGVEARRGPPSPGPAVTVTSQHPEAAFLLHTAQRCLWCIRLCKFSGHTLGR